MRHFCWLAAALLGSAVFLFLRVWPTRQRDPAPVSALAAPIEQDGEQTDFESSPATAQPSVHRRDFAAPTTDENFQSVLASYSSAAVEDRLATLRYLDAEEHWPEAQRAALLALALQDPVEEMRLAALLVVENGYFAAAFPLLDQALNDRSIDVREFAVDALVASGDPRMIASLQRALFDREELVRLRVLDNLELLEPRLQQPVLLRALESSDDLIATTAMQALWEVASPEVIPPVLRLLDSPSAAKREASRRFLAALFNTSFANRVEAEKWWATHQARYFELLRPLPDLTAR
jgi:HEAT repeat protein